MHHNSLGLQCINRSNTDWGYSSIQYNYLVAAFSHPWSQRVTQPHGNTTIASSHPFSSRTPWRHHFQVEPKIMFKFKDFMRTPHPGAVFFPVVSNTLKCRTPWDTVSKHISGKMPFVSRSHVHVDPKVVFEFKHFMQTPVRGKEYSHPHQQQFSWV